MLSKLTLNQWFRDQQLTLIKDHPSAGYLKPKTYLMVIFRIVLIVGDFWGNKIVISLLI